MRKIRSRKKMVNKKYLFVLLVVLIVIILISLFVLISTNKSDMKKRKLIYDNFDIITSKIDDNIYYMFGVNNNIDFIVDTEDDFSFEILDKENNKVDALLLEEDGFVKIKAPKELYNEGESYILKVNGGKFKDENLKEAKEIIFSVKRAASQSSMLKENVITLKQSDVVIDKDIIKVKNNLKKDDIIVIKNKNNIVGMYKINEVNKNEYKVVIPKLDEVYDEFDYYGMEKVDLAKFQTNDDIKAYLVGMIKRRLYDSLIDTVYADSNVEIVGPKWDRKEKKLVYSVKINANEKDNVMGSSFLNYHKSSIEFETSISADLYRNISFDNYDLALIVNMDINNLIKLNSIDNNFNELYKVFNDDNKQDDISEIIEKFNKDKNDELEFSKDIGSIIVSTNVPGLYVNLNSEIMLNVKGKANIETSLNKKIRFVSGINSDIGIYGDYNVVGNGKMDSFGNTVTKMSSLTNIEIQFMNINNLKINVISGLDSNDNIDINTNKKSDTEELTNIKNDMNIKSVDRYSVNANIYNNESNKVIYDKSDIISNNIKEREFVKKIEEAKEKEDDVKKYTAKEIRDLLKQGYDKLNNDGVFNKGEQTVTIKYQNNFTIDVDKNLLINTASYDDGKKIYTCSYNYIDDKMDCSNFTDTQNYIKNICDDFYNDYLICEETGECDNEDAEEWEFLYGSLDACYYETISSSEPKEYKSEFEKILTEVSLTYDDLEVLKGE